MTYTKGSTSIVELHFLQPLLVKRKDKSVLVHAWQLIVFLETCSLRKDDVCGLVGFVGNDNDLTGLCVNHLLQGFRDAIITFVKLCLGLVATHPYIVNSSSNGEFVNDLYNVVHVTLKSVEEMVILDNLTFPIVNIIDVGLGELTAESVTGHKGCS